MKHTLSLLLALGCAGSLAAQAYAVRLGGHQEVPAVSTRGEGTMTLTLDGNSLAVSGSITGLSAAVDSTIDGGAHIHLGYTGENGPIELPLEISSTSSSTAVFAERRYDLDATQAGVLAAALAERRAYVNVHTLAWPAGEVRGQVYGAGAMEVFNAMLYGDQENAPVTTDGVGGVLIEIERDAFYVTGSFQLEGQFEFIGGTGVLLVQGHHGQTTERARVPLAITPRNAGTGATLQRANNRFPIEPGSDFVERMRRRNVYVNVFSKAYLGGEIRGQVTGNNNPVYFSYVSDGGQAPFPDADRFVRVMAEKVFGEDAIKVSGGYEGFDLASLRAESASVVIADPENPSDASVTRLVASDDLDAGGGFFNPIDIPADDAVQQRLFERVGVSTVVGAPSLDSLRSQFYGTCKRAFHSLASASQSVPNSTSAGAGEIITEYQTTRIQASGSVRGLSGPIDRSEGGGWHVHEALAGTAGDIVAPIDFADVGGGGVAYPDDNVIALDDNQAAALKARRYYHNVHTAAFPAGEVRGQLLPRANAYYLARPSAAQTVPRAAGSPAVGGLIGELTGTSLTVSGSFDALAGGFNPDAAGGAHLHGNVAGLAGGILRGLATSAAAGDASGNFAADANTYDVSRGFVDSALQRQVYLNVHSVAHPAGELRGQFVPLARNLLSAVIGPETTVPYSAGGEGSGIAQAEVFDATVVLSGSLTGAGAGDSTPSGLFLGGVAVAGTQVSPVELGAGIAVAIEPAQSGALAAGGGHYSTGPLRGQLLNSPNLSPTPSAAFASPSDGSTFNLGVGTAESNLTVAWTPGADPDLGQSLAYAWELYADTAAAPAVRTELTTDPSVGIAFGDIDALLAGLGVPDGGSATVLHRTLTTDGSLVAYGDFASVTFVRDLSLATREFPEGAVALRGTLTRAGGELPLDVAELPGGTLGYQILTSAGEPVDAGVLVHRGGSANHGIRVPDVGAGVYVVSVTDGAGAGGAWLFVVQ